MDGKRQAAKERGRAGEEFAARALAGDGYIIAARNYRSRYGEIDIVALDGMEICFIEVKARRKGSMIGGVQAVTSQKQKRIILTAVVYLQENRCDLQPRFDIFSVEIGKSGEITGYDHLLGAFGGEACGGGL